MLHLGWAQQDQRNYCISRQPLRRQEGKGTSLPALSHCLCPVGRESAPWVINSPGKACLSLSRHLAEAGVILLHQSEHLSRLYGFFSVFVWLVGFFCFWPPIAFQPILYLENVLISERLLSKEVGSPLDIFDLRMEGPGSANQTHLTGTYMQKPSWQGEGEGEAAASGDHGQRFQL